MIIVDFNNVIYSAIAINGVEQFTDAEEQLPLLRHMVLGQIKKYITDFGYGHTELVIAHDGRDPWRRQFFPHYKAARKTARAVNEEQWKEVFKAVNIIREELRENFPATTVLADGLEADDIIASICTKKDMYTQDKEILIVSSDKDFLQLQKYPWVRQYSPVRKKMIKETNPTLYLFEHIMRGDSGDGVPNVRSDDDTFVTGKRQKPCTQKYIDKCKAELKTLLQEDEKFKEKFLRNKTLIDLLNLHQNVHDKVEDEYNSNKKDLTHIDSHTQSKVDFDMYLSENNLKTHKNNLNDFYLI